VILGAFWLVIYSSYLRIEIGLFADYCISALPNRWVPSLFSHVNDHVLICANTLCGFSFTASLNHCSITSFWSYIINQSIGYIQVSDSMVSDFVEYHFEQEGHIATHAPALAWWDRFKWWNSSPAFVTHIFFFHNAPNCEV